MNKMADHHQGHVDIGICGFGTYVPKNRIDATELARKANIPVERLTEGIGIEHLHIADENDHPLSMGLHAAKEALENAQISGDKLDLIIFVSGGDYDYRNWSPSSAVARELGCHHAYAFEVRNGCAGGNLACSIAGGLMDRDPSIQTALVICADTLSRLVSAEIKECHPLLYFADGAAAVVLKRDHPNYQFLSFAEHTDGELSDLLRIDCGGTKIPFTPTFSDWESIYVKIENPKVFAGLINKTYVKQYVKVIKTALKRSGHDINDIDYILTNQIKASLRDAILNEINIPLEHTYISLNEYGHMGPADALFTLARAHAENKISEGKLIVLATSGLGFSWAASVVRC
jgi:3-oxoacyl-[acyl-carrier-protein] synthase-3